ncbi:MAG: Xaa-Pro peptidase family protein [Deltaproteobacteria bacterium]|nr:Xaa-Pro peptidase family protein [Deltaproteobacteria bacterium]
MNILQDISLCEFTPVEEIKKRITKLKERMERNGICLSIILQNVDIFYFTGSLQKAVLLVPIEAEPVLMVEKNTERARIESPVSQISVKNDRDVRNYVKKYLTGKKKCGMELDVLPVNIFQKWKKMLPDCEIEDISKCIREIRAIKSEFELSLIKKSGKIVKKVFEEASKIIKEGEREIDIAAKLEYIGRINGHQGFLRMRGLNQEMMNIYVIHGVSATIPSFGDVPISGCGITHAIAQGPSFNKLMRGVPTLVDYGGGYNGYITDETRLFLIGEWKNETLKKAYECAYHIINEIVSFGKAGLYATELFDKAFSIAKKANLEDYFMGYGETKVSFVGHGVGLEINELPVLTGRHRILLEEGMVFALEPKFIFPGLGASGLEVDFVVREWGLERVVDFPFEAVYL